MKNLESQKSQENEKDESEQSNKGLSILDGLYGKVISGINPVSEPLEKFVQDYLTQCNGNREKAVEKMVNTQVAKLSASGFLTGLGGLITLPVTIPADISTGLYVQMRMIAAIAYIYGYDIQSDVVKTLVYTTLLGLKIADLVKQVGLKVSEKVALNLLKKLPSKVIVKINQKIGFRFITKFGTKGVLNLWKIVPVIPGIVNAGINAAETKAIAKRAINEFARNPLELPGIKLPTL